MRRYMWPNSCLPSATALVSAAQTASQGRFTLEGVENHAARKLLIPDLLLYKSRMLIISRACLFLSRHRNLPYNTSTSSTQNARPARFRIHDPRFTLSLIGDIGRYYQIIPALSANGAAGWKPTSRKKNF